MLLTSVKNLDEDLGSVRGPCDVCEISVISELFSLHIDCLGCSEVINAKLHVLRAHSGHWIFDFYEASCSAGDVEKREGCHLGFVLAVECKLLARRRPECASFDSELVSTHYLAVSDLAVLTLCHEDCISFCLSYIEALVLGDFLRELYLGSALPIM